jgi:prolyl-tRNA editing enzyme YbaK/EbsC (Cys-tRNA(Pro) deacylase)
LLDEKSEAKLLSEKKNKYEEQQEFQRLVPNLLGGICPWLPG